ncbi:MAG TPA: alpha-amylase family glycosyl hydrolase, partial [Chlamydiales bacterium]|nr:alpha-amylase family glycosyl hydrolase [Chlamydiales bacterium]
MDEISENEVMQVAQELLAKRQIPSAVYRLQMSKICSFQKAAALAPYLKRLGVEALYSSPYFQAVSGSTHGYDVIAPNRLNPELGTDADFDAFCDALSREGLSHILDLVANHMSATCDNPWWCDVLKQGSASVYASYFDLLPGKKIALPILDQPLAIAIENGDVIFDGSWIVVGNQKLPLKEGTDTSLPLEQLLAMQNYELCHWERSGSYRRFFDIAELAAVRQENPDVFSHYHELALDLAAQGKVQGIRIDHPDGLYEPARYFEDLQALYFLEKLMWAVGERFPDRKPDVDTCLKVVGQLDIQREKPLYLLAEKILQGDETLPENLSVHGTVGYDFLVRLMGVFIDQKNEDAFTNIYAEYAGMVQPPDELLYMQKRDFLLTYLNGELEQLCQILDCQKDALTVLLASFPVYRTYISADEPLS